MLPRGFDEADQLLASILFKFFPKHQQQIAVHFFEEFLFWRVITLKDYYSELNIQAITMKGHYSKSNIQVNFPMDSYSEDHFSQGLLFLIEH